MNVVGIGVGAGLPGLAPALETFAEATPDLLSARMLQHRVDRKYVLPIEMVEPVFDRLRDNFRLLRAASAPAATYRTHYFDSDDLVLYNDHRRGRTPRYKVRIRHQLERQVSYFEIKRKGHDGRTEKYRLSRAFEQELLDDVARAFIEEHCPVSPDLLQPRLAVTFRRATLLGATSEERATFDWDFEFSFDGRRHCWNHIAIVEVKQPRFRNDTPGVLALHRQHVRETSISKYCTGTAILAPVRFNSFRPTLRAIERLSA